MICQQQSRLHRIFQLVGVSGLLALATVAVYENVNTFGFIIMDDYLYVVRNLEEALATLRLELR